MNTPEDTEEFNFDDFFVSMDPSKGGMIVFVPLDDMNGNTRKVPITLKRGLSFGDQQAAKMNAITKRVKPDGTFEITKVDEDVFAIELCARGIKSWPFKHSDGTPVPVNRENIKLMLADGVAALSGALVDRISKAKEKNKPFTPPSVSSSDGHS